MVNCGLARTKTEYINSTERHLKNFDHDNWRSVAAKSTLCRTILHILSPPGLLRKTPQPKVFIFVLCLETFSGQKATTLYRKPIILLAYKSRNRSRNSW